MYVDSLTECVLLGNKDASGAVESPVKTVDGLPDPLYFNLPSSMEREQKLCLNGKQC